MVYSNPYQQYAYPVYYPQPVGQMPNQMQPPVNNSTAQTSPLILDTVSGRTSADIYNVDMGKQAILIDIDNPVIYKKSRSLDNKLEMEQYDLVLHKEEDKSVRKVDLNDYVKKDAIEEIVSDRVKEEVDKRLSEISFTPAPKTTRKKTGED